MENNVLREKNNTEPNTSLKNQLTISVSDTEQSKVNGEDTSKENHSPRSLSSLAADKSRLVRTPQQSENNSTSTPKLAKKQEPSEFDPDISIEISPKYKRALLDQPVKETSLSFLTTGFEKLGLGASDGERSNFTLSDDDEAFQECQSSLSDLSGLRNKEEEEKNDTLEAEIFSPNNSNKTLVLDTNVTFDKVITNVTSNSEMTKDEEARIGNTFNMPQDDGGSSEVPGGFEAAEEEMGETTSKIEDLTRVEEISLTQPESVPAKLESVKAYPEYSPAKLESVPAQSDSVSSQLESSPDQPDSVPIKPANLEKTPETNISMDSEGNEKNNNSNSLEDSETFTFANNTVLLHKPENTSQSTSEIELNINNPLSDFKISQEVLETSLPDTPASEEADFADVTMEDVSGDRQEITTFFPESSETFEVQPDEEISYRNIDDLGRHEKTHTIPEDPKVFTEKLKNSFEVQFKMPAAVSKPSFETHMPPNITDADFGCGGSYNFADSDFDYLNKFGSEEARNSLLNRDSVLLKFDPLLSRPVVVNKRLSETKEEVDDFVADLALKIPLKEELEESYEADESQKILPNEHEMSAGIMKDYNIVGDNKSQEESFISEKEDSIKTSLHNNSEYLEKMAELENKMKEADIREEQLLKRISEKDKQISKMNGVVEAYEKAISELIAEKEQLVQLYEKKCADLKNDSELNANHLASLEATFSDLHAKYERAKHVSLELNDREKLLIKERNDLKESLKMQESRYDKMKSHAMAQLEIANNTFADLNRNHSAEVTKLKALLKKEEISRASINEQLIQKAKENAELVKICDELINGTQS